LRQGGVVFFGGSGNELLSLPIYGTGTGPEMTFLPGVQSIVASSSVGGLLYPEGLALDGSGNLYIADEGHGRVVKESPSANGWVQTTVASGFVSPQGVTVDGSGNVYIADTGAAQVWKETPLGSGYVESPIGGGLKYPAGVAVDGSGNVYIVDYGLSYVLMEVPSVASYTQSTVGAGLSGPSAVAVDGSGNVYIADWGHDRVMMETPSAGAYTASVVSSDLRQPNGVAVDGGGNVYVTDSDNNRELKETPIEGEYVQTVLADAATAGLRFPTGVAVDGKGNVYIADEENNRVLKENLAGAPSLSFDATAGGSTSADSPQTVTVANIGNEELEISGVDYPLDFPESSAAALNGCGSATILAAGAACTLAVDFSPVAVEGTKTTFALSETVSLITNTLNKANTLERVALAGTETKLAPALTLKASSATEDIGSPITLTATATGTGTTPQGTVTFYLPGGKMIGAPVALSSGVGSLTTTLTGTNTVTAIFSGGAAYAAATSNSVLVTVAKLAPQVPLKATPNPASAGSQVTFAAAVSEVIEGVPPTGTVEFYVGTNLVGSTTLSEVLGAARASFAAGTFAAGTYSVWAEYMGDKNYLAATSAKVTLTVSK
jgi:sugar lactone lactonase YvrE